MKIVRTCLVALGLVLAATQVGSAVAAKAPAKKPDHVRVTIWPNLAITFYPNTFPHGTWDVVVNNRTGFKHQFTIAGVRWDYIAAHKSAAAKKVKFKFKATYTATLPDCGYPGTAEVPGDTAAAQQKASCGLRPEPGPVGQVKVT